ncbi:hypothetical protein AB0425_20925 [Actinosynnema sp. NPDC051121]|nr:hypothetical protein [Saccharothrix sp.]
MGDQFSVQLDRLDSLARDRLPGMAGALVEVLSHLNHVIDGTYGAFFAHPLGQEDVFAGTREEFRVTTDFLQQVLQDNVGNLELAALALREIASRYRRADGQE